MTVCLINNQKYNVGKLVSKCQAQLLTLKRWLSSVKFKYKPGYRSCDLL